MRLATAIADFGKANGRMTSHGVLQEDLAEGGGKVLDEFGDHCGGILKRLVGQKLGDQFFSEKIREESHGGGQKPEI